MNQASNTLLAGLGQLPMVRIAYTHRLSRDAALPAFKGSLWHGVFGACLHELDRPAYEGLIGEAAQGADNGSRLWALQAPEELDTWVPAGALLRGGLTLMGEGTAYLGACVAALAAMGDKGLGEQRVPAPLVAWGWTRPDGSVVPAQGGFRGADPRVSAATVFEVALAARPADAASLGMHVTLASPLRFRHNGADERTAPSMEAFWRRIVGRVVTLLPADLPDGLFAPGEHAAWLDLASGCQLAQHQLSWAQWDRYSSRQQRTMPFEGLQGHLVYAAPAAQMLPWFHLAQWLQVGSKTTFGMGCLTAAVVQQAVTQDFEAGGMSL